MTAGTPHHITVSELQKPQNREKIQRWLWSFTQYFNYTMAMK